MLEAWTLREKFYSNNGDVTRNAVPFTCFCNGINQKGANRYRLLTLRERESWNAWSQPGLIVCCAKRKKARDDAVVKVRDL